jgi:hypothetical protein
VNNITKTLLGGAALCALATAPAMAGTLHPAMHVTALHAGHAANKTAIREPSKQHLTYTFGVYTYASASDHSAVKLAATYYKWNSNDTLCSKPKMSVKLSAKKTQFAKLGTSSETYSEGCASGPTTFLGDTYANKTGASGDVDNFVSTLLAKKLNLPGGVYKASLHLDVRVTLE